MQYLPALSCKSTGDAISASELIDGVHLVRRLLGLHDGRALNFWIRAPETTFAMTLGGCVFLQCPSVHCWIS